MTRSREELEAREADDLAPYAMRSAATRGRDHRCEPDPYRTDFQRDRDRIVHARAFRRLAYKTQVFINETGDLLRTRLTHTMEVAQLARTAARRLRLNEDLVECIAYVHDLGHPPFGHRGEDLLAELAADFGGFDHHVQALRIVELLEVRYPEWPGLNLTYELRESLIKHGDGSTPVPQRFHPDERRLLEAQLVDQVDSIAYDCHDIDDALRAGIITREDLEEVELWRGAYAEARERSPRQASAKLLVDRALRTMLDALLGDLIDSSQRRLATVHLQDVVQLRQQSEQLIAGGSAMRQAKVELEDWLFHRVYRDWRVNRTFRKARRIIEDLWQHYGTYPDCLPDEHQRQVEAVGRERAVIDYIAGMTDRYAQEEHQRLFRPFTRAW